MSSIVEIESDSSGEIAVPAKLLVDALKNFAEQPLTFSTQEESVLEINANDGKYRISFVPAEEFPKPIEIKDSSLPPSMAEFFLKQLILQFLQLEMTI